MNSYPTPPNWKPSFCQRLVLARAESYEVSAQLPSTKRGNVRAKFWIHWITNNALETRNSSGGEA